MILSAGRNSAIDPMRVVLALFVVALHTGFPDAAPAVVRQMLFNGLYRLAVPVFAVISGYFFLAAMRQGRSGAFIGRLAGLYALWMLLYLPFYGPGLSGIGHALRLAVFGYFQLWFLPGMILAAGLVRLLARPGLVAGAAAVAAGIGLVLQFLVLSGRAEIALDHYRNGLFSIFPFFALGWLMAHGIPDALRRHAGWVAVAGVLAVMAESLVWRWIAGGGWGVDMQLSLLVAAPALFLAAGQVDLGRDGKRFAAMAAFIYFVHVLVMIATSRFGLEGDLKALVVMGVCLGLAFWLGTGSRRPALAVLT